MDLFRTKSVEDIGAESEGGDDAVGNSGSRLLIYAGYGYRHSRLKGRTEEEEPAREPAGRPAGPPS